MGIKKKIWIKNISNSELKQAEKEQLFNGLNFSVTPKQIPTVDSIVVVESYNYQE